MSIDAATTMLRPTDRAFLDANFVWNASIDTGMVCLVVTDYVLPDGLTPSPNRLLVRLAPGFPDIGPDMFWFAEPVRRTDGATIAATESIETHLERTWQRWSRHIGGHWRPGTDDMRSYFTYIRSCLRAAAS